MEHPAQLEACYKKFIQNLDSLVPDGVIKIDLAFLESEGILYPNNSVPKTQLSVSDFNSNFQFNVIESKDKVTLFNEKFVVWIVPTVSNKANATLAIIATLPENKNTNINALHKQPMPSDLSIELAFLTEGIYNSSKIVLTLLEHLIKEIEDNKRMVEHFIKNADNT